MEDHDWRARASAGGFNAADFQTYNQFLEACAEQRHPSREPFNEAVAAAGITETYDRLTGKRTGDSRLVELALGHLRSGAYDDETRGWIARMCETRAAEPYWIELEALFRAAPEGSDERDGLAAALSTCARSKHLEQMMALVEDPHFGQDRAYFLGRSTGWDEPEVKRSLHNTRTIRPSAAKRRQFCEAGLAPKANHRSEPTLPVSRALSGPLHWLYPCARGGILCRACVDCAVRDSGGEARAIQGVHNRERPV